MRLCPYKMCESERDIVSLLQGSLSFHFSLAEKEQEVHWSLFVISFLENCN